MKIKEIEDYIRSKGLPEEDIATATEVAFETGLLSYDVVDAFLENCYHLSTMFKTTKDLMNDAEANTVNNIRRVYGETGVVDYKLWKTANKEKKGIIHRICLWIKNSNN